MYESFYGFQEKPFSLLPDPSFLYLGKKHSVALSILEYSLLNQAGFVVITGNIGCGKTTLIRRLLNGVPESVTVGLISNTHKSFGDLLEWVLMAFGLEYENKSKAQRYEMFVEFLVSEYGKGHQTVLIVDEAQNMDIDTLEELRMLSNVNADKDQIVQIILAGQPDLLRTLRRPELTQFAQRIVMNYHLEPLDREESVAYIKHRVSSAGGPTDLFTKEACAAIYKFSGGVPRLINNLSDTALVYGFAAQKNTVDLDTVKEVLRDKAATGLFKLPQSAKTQNSS